MMMMKGLFMLALTLPAVLGSSFYLFGCSNFESQFDPITETAEGKAMLTTLLASPSLRLYLWDAGSAESSYKCVSLNFSASNMQLYANGNSNPSVGTYSIVYGPPSTYIFVNGTGSTNKLNSTVMCADSKGNTKLYPLYVSANEIILLCCYNNVLGHIQQSYVFSNQDLSSLNSSCMSTTVSGVVKIKMKASNACNTSTARSEDWDEW